MCLVVSFLIILILLVSAWWRSFHLLVSFSFFLKYFKVFTAKLIYFLVRFSLCLFKATVKTVVSLISFSTCLLLEYRKAIDFIPEFCILKG